MSAFSRGILLLPRQCIQTRILNLISPSKGSSEQHRLFSSALRLHTTKAPRTAPSPNKALPKSKALAIPEKLPTATTQAYQTYESTLAQKLRPTVLYEAPSHAAFMFASYSSGLFCMAYGTYSFWSMYLNAPPNLAEWIPIAYGGVAVGMAAAGTFIILGPTRLIRSITALPQSSKIPGAIPRGLATPGNSELVIEVVLRKMFPVPLFPARKLYVKPAEMSLPSQLVPAERRISEAEIKLQRQQEEVAKQKAWEYEQTHVMSRGVRHLSRAFFELFQGVARVWTREGFMKLDVKGQVYKLDITGGWALDGGKALDRLATIKPKVY